MAHLSGGVAIIKVGAATESEMKETKYRVEDALQATKAAVEEGIVPGGGVALIRAKQALDHVQVELEEAVGINILRRALEEPVRKIASNAGLDGAVIANRVAEEAGDIGFNAANNTYGDMFLAGIVDPTKVTRLALQNAASVAALLLTTECVVIDKKEEEKK